MGTRCSTVTIKDNLVLVRRPLGIQRMVISGGTSGCGFHFIGASRLFKPFAEGIASKTERRQVLICRIEFHSLIIRRSHFTIRVIQATALRVERDRIGIGIPVRIQLQCSVMIGIIIGYVVVGRQFEVGTDGGPITRT